MPTCTIDGVNIDFEPGENLVDIAKRGGVEIPVFCYHPALTVVAQCRMCTVEIEGAPKLMTACSTPAADGMVVHTRSEKAKEQQEAVMEFLLINHPLDCPICDKSGECDLQDHSYDHGSPYMRTTEDRRTYLDLDMGPVIQKNMNRCIHCTRCIRFGDEIANIREMVAVQRGNNTEITTLDGRALETDYAGNYADVCPTGSLTIKDFRFTKRAWMLKKTETVCEGCSKGCNMEIHWDGTVMHRCLPRENKEINGHWLCDEGRFNFRYVQNKTRIREPLRVKGQKNEGLTWTAAMENVRELLDSKSVVLVGSDLTQEELKITLDFAEKELGRAKVFHFGTPGIKTTKDDGSEDELLKMKSKTANLNGAESLGIKAFDKVPAGIETVLIFRGGRAQLPEVTDVKKVGVGVFHDDEISGFDLILPGAAFAEKNGTVINHQGTEQKFQLAVAPPRGCKQISEILMLWMNSAKKSGAA